MSNIVVTRACIFEVGGCMGCTKQHSAVSSINVIKTGRIVIRLCDDCLEDAHRQSKQARWDRIHRPRRASKEPLRVASQ